MNVKKLIQTSINLLLLSALLLGCAKESSDADPELIIDPNAPTTSQPATPFDVYVAKATTQVNPTDTLPILFRIVFSREVDAGSFDINDLTNAGSATGVTWNLANAGNNISYTLFAVTALSEGTIIPEISSGGIFDKYGNNNNSSIGIDNIVFYTTELAVTIEQSLTQVDPTAVFPVEFEVLFSEAINATTFTVTDIIQNGSATGVVWNLINSGDDKSFILQATSLTTAGTIIPSIAAATVQTSLAENNTVSTSLDNSVLFLESFDVTIDQKLAQLDPANVLPIEFDVVFSEAIDNSTFTIADITQNGSATGVVWNLINSGDDINFTLQAITVADNGTVIPSIAGSLIQTISLKENTLSSSVDNSVQFDGYFSATVEQKLAQLDPAAALPIQFDIVFSEAIDSSTFIPADVTQSGTATGITWNIINSGDNINFTLEATAILGEGTLIPSLGSDQIQTLSLKNNMLSTSVDNIVTYDTLFNVTIEQRLSQTDPSNSFPIEFDIFFEEAINVPSFIAADIAQGGSATGVVWNIINSGDNINFILQATSTTSEGTIIPSLAASLVQTNLGKNNTASVSVDNTVTYSLTFEVTIEQKLSQADPTAALPIEFDVVFSEAIDPITFIGPDVIQNGTATGVTWNIINSGDNINFTLQAISTTSDGNIVPTLAASTIQTSTLKNNNLSTSVDNDVNYNSVIDLTIEQKLAQLDPSNTLPVEFDVVFDSPIDASSFIPADITQNGAATGIIWNIINSGDNMNFTLQATSITGEGTVQPSVAAGAVTVSYGAVNNLSTSIDNSVLYEMNFTAMINQKVAQLDPANTLPIEFDVVFGQAINPATFTIGDIIQSGSATGITWNIINSGDNINFTLQATAVVGTGTVIPNLAVDTVQDGGTSNNYASTSTDNSVDYALTFDVTLNQKSGQADPANSYPVEFTVVFSTAIDALTFTSADITQNGAATAVVWNIINSGDSITFTLQATGSATDGTIIPSIAAGTVQDSGVMNNTVSSATDNSVTLDTSIPITNIIEPVDASYGEAAELLFQVVYSEAINVTGAPRIPITVGAVTRYANYFQGDGTTGIEFKYTVAAGENDANGIALQSGSIDLFGGTMIGAVTSGNARVVLGGIIDPLTNVLVDTTQLPPNQVTGVVTAPTTSNTEMGVSWNVPFDNGTALVDYSVQYREQGTSTWINVSPNPTSNTVVVTSLTAGIMYEIRVAASNGVLGPYSAIATAEIFDVMSLNPIAWLDATDINGDGTTPTNGSKVATWIDLTGIASNATEANTALQPVYTYNVQSGLPAVRFDNLDRGLSGGFSRTVGTDLTIIVVGQYDTGSVDKCMFEFRDTATGNARAFFIDRRYAGNTLYSPALTKGNFHMWTITNSGIYSTVTEDGVTSLYAGNNDFNTDFTGAGTYYLGDDATGGNRLNGYIGEFLIFDKNLSGAEITQIENYIKSKWSIP